MKTLNALLKEIKAKDKKTFSKLEKQINAHAQRLGLVKGPPTEHPVKPPDQP